MPIISTSFNDIGNAGQVPSIVRIETDDSLATVLTTGYLNVLTHQNLPLSETSLVLVSTGTGVNKAVTVMSMTYSSGDWSLVVMEGYQATGSGAVNSVLGTANRITSSGGNNPVIDIAATYVGQASITTVGAIGSGTWASTAIPVTNGGTGLTTMTTAYAPVISGTTATGNLQVASTGLATSGFVLTSNGSSAVPSFQAIPAGGMTWANVAGTTQAAAINTGYVIGNASQTTVTLPATAALGSVVAIQGKGAAGWVLTANAGQTIQVGQSATSSGGTVTSAANFDAIQVVCITANTTWAVSYVLSSGVTTA